MVIALYNLSKEFIFIFISKPKKIKGNLLAISAKIK